MLVKRRPKRRRHTTETVKVKKCVNISKCMLHILFSAKDCYVIFFVWGGDGSVVRAQDS